ncbi:MAG: anti-sigma factor [Pseudomonadota bacterium]
MKPEARQPAMDKHHHPPPPAGDEAAWHALADGRLSPADAAALRRRLEGQAGAEETLAHWQQQRQQLRALHQGVLDEPVPEALLAAALRTSDRKERQGQWWRWGGMAASVLLAFALGWTGRSLWPATGRTDSQALVLAATGQRFAQQASVAHAVYQPEVRHPVEVPAAQQEHLVQWLSKRLGRPLKLPMLADEGYELVGGRLLPGDAGARAQFMYQNTKGERITLYLGAIARPGASAPAARPGAPTQPGAAETAFQFTSDGPVPGFYWADQGFGYALSGQLSRQELLTLAAAVHRQL